MFDKIKEAYNAFIITKLGIEVKSAVHTFLGIFIGTITLAPAFNELIGTDLPTINELKDVIPVILDAIYRSAWVTIITVTGLIKYRQYK